MGGVVHVGVRTITGLRCHSQSLGLSSLSTRFHDPPHIQLTVLLRALHTWRHTRAEASQARVVYVAGLAVSPTFDVRDNDRLLLLRSNTLLPFVRSSRPSKGKLKSRTPPPSNHLIATLLDLNYHEAVPAFHSNGTSRCDERRASVGIGGVRVSSSKTPKLPLPQPGRTFKSAIVTLTDVLAGYLQHLHPVLTSATVLQDTDADVDTAILKAFPERVQSLLASKGYYPEDVITWAWITTASDAERATLRLSVATIIRTADGNPARPIPTFVFLFLLRRTHINAKTLRVLLVYAWSRLRGVDPPARALFPTGQNDQVAKYQLQVCRNSSEQPRFGPASLPRLDEATIIIMVVRLFRHARQVWIQAIVSIADMIITYVDGNMAYGQVSRLKPRTAARLTLIYNRMLSLLSLPSRVGPFLSVPHYQRAQFNLIKKMGEFKPPLPVTQEGYRAVVKVQLAHKKTASERRWAEDQAKSWPPWREEKLGIDAEEESDKGVSRAVEALNRMREAGYKGEGWEEVAAIYAGWDTDGSPTIQTRTIIRRAPVAQNRRSRGLRDRELPERFQSEQEVHDVWAARLRATRTVQEAWACFLVHEDLRLHFTPDVYEAMFEKLVFENRRVTRPTWERAGSGPNPTHAGLPGDGKELCAAPLSPNEAVYVRSEPPELVDLFDRMIKEGMQPSERGLAFLVSHADSLALGIRFLRSSRLLGAQSLRALIDLGMSSTTQDVSWNMALREVPERIFAAFVSLLCHLPTRILCDVPVRSALGPTVPWEEDLEQSTVAMNPEISPLHKAHTLVHARRPQGRPAWNAFMAALARYGVHFGPSFGRARNSLLHSLMSWKLICDAVRQMQTLNLEIDTQSFQILCVGLEKAVLACLEFRRRLIAGHECYVLPASHPFVQLGNSPFVQLDSEAESLLNTGAAYIKSAFATLVGHDVHVEPRIPAVVDPLSGAIEETLSNEISGLLPSLLSVPGPSQIHAYIRVLGLLQDYQGLLTLARWLATFADELHAVAKEFGAGARLQRRCLIAFRVVLERTWQIGEAEENGDMTASPGAPEEVIVQVRDIMAEAEYWGPWPDDEEVEHYCKGRRHL
ncbi:MAG: hypothetical protein M1816_005574 [Peltula sp. TS41687]|nr:MAG: hypothetical protein M1816_005574 [Peltula sp. TS41687]